MKQKTIRLHVGVHKTATTYLQHYLLLNRSALAKEGLAYWPMEDIRGQFQSAWDQCVLERYSRRERLISLIRRNRIFPKMRAWFELDRDILLSEENLLGECCDFFDGEIYPNAAARLACLARALPNNKSVEIWLCLRSYPDFLASVYGEASRFNQVPLPEAFAERHVNPEGAWPKLIDDIRIALPAAKLHIWDYEDFRSIEPRIIEGMTGVSASLLQSLQQSNIRPSASDRAIRACAALPSEIQWPERMFQMLVLEKLYPIQCSSDRFSPWTADQRIKMDAAWKRDRDLIAAREDIDFIDGLAR
ncbi:hypothetical protein HJ526_17070 [Donghicola sp. C2-DW-16]|uniref:Sulfotransferase family protein n=1 Tax=Donghicola mangrovi TaxID=2729614 RepID=A0ABX2PI06_9RHOB|nr:hypothetical protein [Donghicola mangrovi]NVO29138.1 hypothetical protein [Donghicola mangrovi]